MKVDPALTVVGARLLFCLVLWIIAVWVVAGQAKTAMNLRSKKIARRWMRALKLQIIVSIPCSINRLPSLWFEVFAGVYCACLVFILYKAHQEFRGSGILDRNVR